MEEYNKGWSDAMKLAKRIFFDFVDRRVDEGVFYCDLDHVRAYKRYFTERAKHNGGFAIRNKKRHVE